MSEPVEVDTIVSKKLVEDENGYYMRRSVTFHLWDDGSVTWTSEDHHIDLREL